MNVGFTGTRKGMTARQLLDLDAVLRSFNPPGEFHHGDCVGADDQAATIARQAGFVIVCHPPADPRLRAFHPYDRTLPTKGHLARNRDIVDSCGVLIAAPAEAHEQPFGGTWYTIRYARGVRRDTRILTPW